MAVFVEPSISKRPFHLPFEYWNNIFWITHGANLKSISAYQINALNKSKEHTLKQSFERQQEQFLEVFKTFDFKNNVLVSTTFTCDYYRGEEFSGILNSMPIEFVTTVFCDALLNSALYQLNTTLLETLGREHFVYNSYNVFNHDCNVTNKYPQFFFDFLKSKNDPRIMDKIYTTTRSYFAHFYPLLAASLGRDNARKLLLTLKYDRDLVFSNDKIEPKIINAYMKGISDAIEGLDLKTAYIA